MDARIARLMHGATIGFEPIAASAFALLMLQAMTDPERALTRARAWAEAHGKSRVERMNARIREDVGDPAGPADAIAGKPQMIAVGGQTVLITADGIAVTWLTGPLANAEGDVTDSEGMRFGTAYLSLVAAIDLLIAEPGVKGLVMPIDSPGGDVVGLRSVTEAMKRMDASGKPVVTVAAGYSASCACWIGSMGSKGGVLLTPGSRVGYLGVYTTVMDLTEKAAKDGMKVDVIGSNDVKLDGHPFVPLTDEGRARLLADVTKLNEQSLSDIAASRGLNVEAVRAYSKLPGGAADGLEVVRAGMADAVVGSIGEAVDVCRRLADSRNLGGSQSALDMSGAGNSPVVGSAGDKRKDEAMSITRDSLKNQVGGQALMDLLIGEGKAAGIAEAQASALASAPKPALPATIDELQAEKFDDGFVLSCLKQKLTLADARSERLKMTAALVPDLQKKVGELEAKNAELTKSLGEDNERMKRLADAGVKKGAALQPHSEPGNDAATPNRKKGTLGGSEPTAFIAKAQTMADASDGKMTLRDAMSKLSVDEPELFGQHQDELASRGRKKNTKAA